MAGPFRSTIEDKGLVITLIREANLVLASLDKDSDKYNITYWRFNECINVMRSIEKSDPQQDEDINFILRTINTIWNKGVLAPLTLEDDEFDIADRFGVRHNKRYPHIVKYCDDSILNNNAYKVTVRHTYTTKDNTEIENYECNINNPILFISKGGYLTGDYIGYCEIRQEIIDKHNYTIQSIVNIPASRIILPDKTIYVVDHREPKLKSLMDFYHCEIITDNDIKLLKLDIRKFKKL